MVGLRTSPSDRAVVIAGHGVTVAAPFQLTDYITVRPNPPKPTAEKAAAGCAGFGD